jgi:hypothetical protein
VTIDDDGDGTIPLMRSAGDHAPELSRSGRHGQTASRVGLDEEAEIPARFQEELPQRRDAEVGRMRKISRRPATSDIMFSGLGEEDGEPKD